MIQKQLASLFFVLAFCGLGIAQTPWDASAKIEPVGQVQVTFLTALSAELAVVDGKTIILAEELEPSRQYGVVLIADESTRWIEIHDKKKPFPPIVASQYDPEKHPGRFLVRGEPGQAFYVSMRSDGPPTWTEVVVAPEVAPDPDAPGEPGDPSDPDDPSDPPPSFESIMELSKAKAAALDDPATAARIKAAIIAACDRSDALCKAGRCEGLPITKMHVVGGIEAALSARTGDSLRKDWLAAWRRPISDAVNNINPQDPPAYVAVMRSVAAGL